MTVFKKQLSPAFLAAGKPSRRRGLIENILSITEDIRRTILMPASRNLDAIKITQKPNEDMRQSEAKNISIRIDRDCENMLEARLRKLYPEALLIGEEMFGDLPSDRKHALLDRAAAAGDRMVILTDALDGTRDFRNGGDGFAVMVTVIKNGETLACVVHRCTDHSDPAALGHTLTYEKGDGVRLNGRRLNALSNRRFPDKAAELRGYAGFEFIAAKHGRGAPLPNANDNKVPDLAAHFDSLSDLWTCSKMYDDLITGRHHFMLVPPPVDMFDYPSGIALVEQSGGVARFLDGTRASFAEMVKRQAFVKDRAFKLEDTLVLAVSEGSFKAVQKAAFEQAARLAAAPRQAIPKQAARAPRR